MSGYQYKRYRNAERVRKHRALKKMRNAMPERNELENQDIRMYIINVY